MMVLFMLVGLVVLGLGLVRPGGGVIARVCDPTLSEGGGMGEIAGLG